MRQEFLLPLTACRLQLLVRQLENQIGLAQLAGLQPLAEPFDPLPGCAMREILGHDIALGQLLQPVIADGHRSSDGFFFVARLQNPHFLISPEGPYTGEIISLELQSYRELILRIVGQLPMLRFDANSHQVLHVMADFVCDYIGVGEITRGVALTKETLPWQSIPNA